MVGVIYDNCRCRCSEKGPATVPGNWMALHAQVQNPSADLPFHVIHQSLHSSCLRLESNPGTSSLLRHRRISLHLLPCCRYKTVIVRFASHSSWLKLAVQTTMRCDVLHQCRLHGVHGLMKMIRSPMWTRLLPLCLHPKRSCDVPSRLLAFSFVPTYVGLATQR